MAAHFNDNDVDDFMDHALSSNASLYVVHEACGPFYTSKERARFGNDSSYGGITGSVRPYDVGRIARLLMTGRFKDSDTQLLSSDFLLKKHTSVFLDAGSGTGRPTFYFARLALRCSIGFDIDELQVSNSRACLNKLVQLDPSRFSSPISLFKQDALALDSLGPVTHAYCFIGYPLLAVKLARLALTSPQLKVICVVTLDNKWLTSAGLVDDKEVIALHSMKMSGGNSYRGAVIPLTEYRKRTIAAALAEEEESFTMAEGAVEPNQVNAQLELALECGPNQLDAGNWQQAGRPIRACRAPPKAMAGVTMGLAADRKRARLMGSLFL